MKPADIHITFRYHPTGVNLVTINVKEDLIPVEKLKYLVQQLAENFDADVQGLSTSNKKINSSDTLLTLKFALNINSSESLFNMQLQKVVNTFLSGDSVFKCLGLYYDYFPENDSKVIKEYESDELVINSQLSHEPRALEYRIWKKCEKLNPVLLESMNSDVVVQRPDSLNQNSRLSTLWISTLVFSVVSFLVFTFIQKIVNRRNYPYLK